MAERSKVWTFFSKSEDSSHALCRLCSRKLVHKGGTTSNLIKHMEHVHASQWTKENNKGQKSSDTGDSATKSTTGPMDSFLREKTCPPWRSGHLTSAIADMIALDLRPVSLVNGIGFQKLMQVAEPGFRIPSTTHVMSLLKKKHEEGKIRLKRLLADADVSLTTDTWTSKATESYVTTTCHFIDKQWCMRSFVLETTAFRGHHTAENIATKLVDVATAYNVLSRVTAVTHDEAANMVAAARTAQQKAIEHVGSGKWKSNVCAAHRLQTCLRHALEIDEIEAVTGAGRKIVGHFKHSCLAMEALKAKQQDLKVPCHKLIQDVKTRWNSTFYMLERLLEQRMPVLAVLNDRSVSKRSDADLDLTGQQWTLVEDLITNLKPYEAATRLLSAEHNVSLSSVLPIIDGLWKNAAAKVSDCQVISDMKKAIRQQLEMKFSLNELDADALPVIASAIDPRFKGLTFLDDTGHKEAVHEELVKLLEACSAGTESAAVDKCTVVAKDLSEDTEEPPQKQAKTSDWDLIGVADSPTNCKGMSAEKETGKAEVLRFLSEKSQPLMSDPLAWWRQQERTFPRLAKLAKKVFCVTGASTPAERVFSASGLIVNHQ